MKKIVLSISLLSSILVFGQKSEIESATKLLNSNPAEALNVLNKAESLINAGTAPSLLIEYYYNKGQAALKQNQILEAAKSFAKVTSLESKGYFYGKNKETKEKKYYFTEKEAKEGESKGEIDKIKSQTIEPKYSEFIRTSLASKAEEVNKEASTSYQNKEYSKAGQKFSELHFILKALNSADDNYYYYSAASYYSGNEKDKSLAVLNDLINSGATGVNTSYTALDKSKNTRVNIGNPDKNQLELLKLNPDYSDIKEEKTPSIEGDIYNLAVSIYMEKENYPKAIEICEKGLVKVPNHKNLSDLQGNIYLKSGQSEKFIETLKIKLASNPNDETTLYNLGVMYGGIAGKEEEAKTYYEKAVAIKPDYSQAYINLASLMLKPDEALVKQINALKSTPADKAKSKILTEQRKGLFNKALPYLEKAYAINPNDLAIVSTIKRVYGVLENDAKYNEFKAKETQLKK